jgi:hypothetical protein
MHLTETVDIKHVVEKKAKNAQNTHHVALHQLNVKHLVKVKNGEKQNNWLLPKK